MCSKSDFGRALQSRYQPRWSRCRGDFDLPTKLCVSLVLEDLRRLERHVSARLFSDVAGTAERNVLTLYGDGTVFLHRDACAAAFDYNFIASIDRQSLANLARLIVPNLSREILTDLQTLIFADTRGAVVADRRRPVRPHARGLALAVGLRLAQTDGL